MVVNHASQTAMPEQAACAGKGPAPAAVPGKIRAACLQTRTVRLDCPVHHM